MKNISIFFLLLLVPIFAAVTVVLAYDYNITNQSYYSSIIKKLSVSENLQDINSLTSSTNETALTFADSISASGYSISATQSILNNITYFSQQEDLAYYQQLLLVQSAMEQSLLHASSTDSVLETILSRVLGAPIGQSFSSKSNIKVYSLEDVGYQGYMAKVRLIDPGALKLVLAGEQIRNPGETTRQAALRNDAIFAINAGGFSAVSGTGNLAPLGTTVIDGEILTFSETDGLLTVIGFDINGRLVGGLMKSQDDVIKAGVHNGASFVPALLKNGQKQPIPNSWAKARHPRTIIGQFANGDLLFIVIDGRQAGYSNGVTLEDAQEKLLEFNVLDAYNLDGGGSSTFYYNGRVLNRPSAGERRVMTNIIIEK